MNIEEIVKNCIPKIEGVLDKDDIVRYTRQIIHCLLTNMNLKFIFVDNGLKFNSIFYIEFTSHKDLDENFNKFIRCVEEIEHNVPQELAQYLTKRKVVSMSSEKLVLFDKEYVVFKLVY